MSESSAGTQEAPISNYEDEEELLLNHYTEQNLRLIRASIPGELTEEQLVGLKEAALKLAHNQREDEKKYKYDRLMSNLLTRAAMEDELDTEFKNMEREGSEDAVMFFIDMNNLKNINDNLGHELGDEALKMFNSVLTRLRPSDKKGRWGGDEAVVLFKGKIKEAVLAAERIRQEMKHKDAARTNGSLGVSFSIGLVPYQRGMNVSQLVSEADKTMYVSKHQLNKDAIAISGINDPQEIIETERFIRENGLYAPIVSVPPTSSPLPKSV